MGWISGEISWPTQIATYKITLQMWVCWKLPKILPTSFKTLIVSDIIRHQITTPIQIIISDEIKVYKYFHVFFLCVQTCHLHKSQFLLERKKIYTKFRYIIFIFYYYFIIEMKTYNTNFIQKKFYIKTLSIKNTHKMDFH